MYSGIWICGPNSNLYSLEYYGECYCGASVAGVQVPDSQCNYPCSGNSSEACGGSYILSVYQDTTFPQTNSSVITDYIPSGCYTEGTNGRSLVYAQDNLNSSTMTVEVCLESCKSNGYPLAGVEYGVSKQSPHLGPYHHAFISLLFKESMLLRRRTWKRHYAST